MQCALMGIAPFNAASAAASNTAAAHCSRKHQPAPPQHVQASSPRATCTRKNPTLKRNRRSGSCLQVHGQRLHTTRSSTNARQLYQCTCGLQTRLFRSKQTLSEPCSTRASSREQAESAQAG